MDLKASAWPVFDVAAAAMNSCFLWPDNDRTELGALTVQQYDGAQQRLETCARGFVAARPTDTLSLLKDISFGITSFISYQSREEQGTQAPLITLDRGWG